MKDVCAFCHTLLTVCIIPTGNTKKPNTVYIYADGNLVKGSPFASYSSAHQSLGLKPSSNTCNRYIDTNRLYKNKYLFFS